MWETGSSWLVVGEVIEFYIMNTPDSFRDKAIADFRIAAKKKYDIGQAEHGGFLPDRANLDEIEEEVIDLWFYLRALRHKINRMSSSETLVGAIKQTEADNE